MRACKESEEQETHIGNSRIGQHPLDVALRDRNDITESDRCERRHQQHVLPDRDPFLKSRRQQTQQDRKSRKLWHRRQV